MKPIYPHALQAFILLKEDDLCADSPWEPDHVKEEEKLTPSPFKAVETDAYIDLCSPAKKVPDESHMQDECETTSPMAVVAAALNRLGTDDIPQELGLA